MERKTFHDRMATSPIGVGRLGEDLVIDIRRGDSDRVRLLRAVPLELSDAARLRRSLNDRLPAFKDRPLKERFGLCPWGLYFIEVKAV